MFVGGIGPDANEDELKTLFSQYGGITSVKIIYDRTVQPPRCKGFGFVTFDDTATADQLRTVGKLDYKGRSVDIGKAGGKSGEWHLSRWLQDCRHQIGSLDRRLRRRRLTHSISRPATQSRTKGSSCLWGSHRLAPRGKFSLGISRKRRGTFQLAAPPHAASLPGCSLPHSPSHSLRPYTLWLLSGSPPAADPSPPPRALSLPQNRLTRRRCSGFSKSMELSKRSSSSLTRAPATAKGALRLQPIPGAASFAAPRLNPLVQRSRSFSPGAITASLARQLMTRLSPIRAFRSYGFVTFADRHSADNVKKIRQADFMGRTMNFGDAVAGGLKAKQHPSAAAPSQQASLGRGGPAGPPGGGMPMGYGGMGPWAGAPGGGMLPPGFAGMGGPNPMGGQMDPNNGQFVQSAFGAFAFGPALTAHSGAGQYDPFGGMGMGGMGPGGMVQRQGGHGLVPNGAQVKASTISFMAASGGLPAKTQLSVPEACVFRLAGQQGAQPKPSSQKTRPHQSLRLISYPHTHSPCPWT